jgi:hypothetical protein
MRVSSITFLDLREPRLPAGCVQIATAVLAYFSAAEPGHVG